MTYKALEHMKAHVPDWETYAGMTAGQVWDLEPNQDTFWRVMFCVVSGSEGITRYPYRDIKGHPTVAVGFLIGLVNPSTGVWQDAVAAKTEFQNWRWSDGEGGPELTPEAAWREMELFMDATRKFRDGANCARGKPWNVVASSYAQYSRFRLMGTTGELFQKKATSGGYWRSVKKTFPNWRDLPYFGVAGAFYLAWARGSVLFKNGNATTEALIRDGLTNGRFRDFEEAATDSIVASNLKGDYNAASAYNVRDCGRASAMYFCESKCNGQCTKAALCDYKGKPAPKSNGAPAVAKPAATLQPHQPTAPSEMKYDDWTLELRVWEPWARTFGYQSSAMALLSGAKFSMRADGHRDFGDLSEKPEDAAHRVFVTAKFRYFYKEVSGKKVGYGISAKVGLDPKVDGDCRTAAAQKLPVYGPTVRFRSDDNTVWKLDDSEKFPQNNRAGTKINWGAISGDKFQSFTLKVDAENPAHPQLEPNVNATLSVGFSDNKLKLHLECERYPSVGVRLRRVRQGASADMLPNWKTPLVDAAAEYEKYLHDVFAAKVPAPTPAAPKQPGPAQMDSGFFKYSRANEKFDWTHDVDWTAGPAAAKPTTQTETSPAAAHPGGKIDLKALYTTADQSELFDHFSRVWTKAQTEAAKLNPSLGKGLALDTTPGHMNLFAVRGLKLLGDLSEARLFDKSNVVMEVREVSYSAKDRTAWDDTMFVLWVDAAGKKNVRGFTMSTEPTASNGGEDGTCGWLADPCQSTYIIAHHKMGQPEHPLNELLPVMASGTSPKVNGQKVGYRALIPENIYPVVWRAKVVNGDLSPQRDQPKPGNNTFHIHWGGNNPKLALTAYEKSWSQGCQILYHYKSYGEFIKLLENDGSLKGTATTYLAAQPTGTHNRRLTYTLVSSLLVRQVLGI